MFTAFFVDNREELAFAGPISEDSVGRSLIQAFPGMGSIVKMNGEVHDSMSECATDNSRLSGCLHNHLENDFGGKCRYEGRKIPAHLSIYICLGSECLGTSLLPKLSHALEVPW